MLVAVGAAGCGRGCYRRVSVDTQFQCMHRHLRYSAGWRVRLDDGSGRLVVRLCRSGVSGVQLSNRCGILQL